jgi:hypothetical protein
MAAVILSSCIGRPANVQSAPATEPKADEAARKKLETGRAEATAVDATGSYDELIPALRRLARFTGEELNQGDTFCAFWIKGGIGDSVDFLIEPTTLPVPQRRIGDPAEIDVLNLKRKMRDTLLSYANAKRFKKAGQTDLLQAIAYAGRLLHADANSSREKWLLLFTDLEDNQKKDVDLNLEGVHVRVFYVPARNDLNGLDKKIFEWKERFKRAKVASVEIYDVGQSDTLPRLLTAL